MQLCLPTQPPDTYMQDRGGRNRVPAGAREEQPRIGQSLLRRHSLPPPHDRRGRRVLCGEPVAEERRDADDGGVHPWQPAASEPLVPAGGRGRPHRALVGLRCVHVGRGRRGRRRRERRRRRPWFCFAWVLEKSAWVLAAPVAAAGGRESARFGRLGGLDTFQRRDFRAHGHVLQEIERRNVARDLARVQVARALAQHAGRRLVLLLRPPISSVVSSNSSCDLCNSAPSTKRRRTVLTNSSARLAAGAASPESGGDASGESTGRTIAGRIRGGCGSPGASGWSTG